MRFHGFRFHIFAVQALAAGQQITFSDVSSGDPNYSDIAWAVENGIFFGVSESCFLPDQPLNRGMAVTVIHRMADCPQSQYDMQFQDIAAGSWYYEAVAWAAEQRIVLGVTDHTFLPTSEVTREQMAIMLYRFAKTEGIANAAGDLSGFSDGEDVSLWAREAVEWAVRSGVMDFKPDQRLDPQGVVSRGDGAGMLRRFEQYCAESERPVPSPEPGFDGEEPYRGDPKNFTYLVERKLASARNADSVPQEAKAAFAQWIIAEEQFEILTDEWLWEFTAASGEPGDNSAVTLTCSGPTGQYQIAVRDGEIADTAYNPAAGICTVE